MAAAPLVCQCTIYTERANQACLQRGLMHGWMDRRARRTGQLPTLFLEHCCPELVLAMEPRQPAQRPSHVVPAHSTEIPDAVRRDWLEESCVMTHGTRAPCICSQSYYGARLAFTAKE